MSRFIIGASPTMVSGLAEAFADDPEVAVLSQHPDRLVVDLPPGRAESLRQALGAAVVVEPDVGIVIGPVVPPVPPGP